MLKEVHVDAVYLPASKNEPASWYAKCKELKGFHLEAKTLAAMKRVVVRMVPIFISEAKMVTTNSPITIHFSTSEIIRAEKAA